jgi:type I restriction enzyme S subunit
MIDATLPRDWRLTAISEVADVIMGQSPPSKTYNTNSDGLPFFQGKAEFGDETPVPVKWCTAPTRIAEPDDILLSVRAPVGATNIASESCGIGRGLAALRSIPELLEPWYLLYALRLFEPLLVNRGQGSTFNAINQKDIESVKIPLPPLSEQRRIVDSLRQADDLRCLRREADARMADLQASLFEEMFGAAIVAPKDWPVERLKKLGEVSYGLTVNQERRKAGDERPYLRVGNVYRWQLDLSDLETIGTLDGDTEKYSMLEGDVLVVEGHANPKELGRAAVWNGEVQGCLHQNHILRVRPDTSKITSNYLMGFINSALGRNHMLRYGKTSSGLYTINSTDLAKIPVVCPPIELQLEFEQRYAACKAIDTQLPTIIARLNDLLDSLRARAFTGELTAAWREQHAAQLHDEAVQHDIALGARPARPRLLDFESGLVTQEEKDAFARRMQEVLVPAAERLAQIVTPTIQLSDVLKIEPLIDLSELVAPLSEYQATVNAKMFEGLKQVSESARESLAKSIEPIHALIQSVSEAQQQRVLEWAEKISRWAALVTRRLDEEHPRYHSLRALSDEQYGVYLAALQSDGYFTAESLLDEDDLTVDNVRRTLALLETLGLVARVNVPAAPTGAALFYVPAYRVPAPDDDSRDDDLAALEATFPGVAA